MNDWGSLAGAIGVFLLLITIVGVGLTQLGATLRARAQLAREAEFRKLAETAILVQDSTDKRLAEIDQQLTQMRMHLADVEHVLKQVE